MSITACPPPTKAQLQGATLVLLSGVTLSTKAILAKLAYRHGVMP
jgi:hypothetical protein